MKRSHGGEPWGTDALRVPQSSRLFPWLPSQDQITTAPLVSFNFSDLIRDKSRFFTVELDFDLTVKADGTLRGDGVAVVTHLNISVSSPLNSATMTGKPTQAGTRYSRAGCGRTGH